MAQSLKIVIFYFTKFSEVEVRVEVVCGHELEARAQCH